MATIQTASQIASVEDTPENESDAPGLIIADQTGEPLYANSAAQEILCFARSTNQVDRKKLIRQRVRAELSLHKRGGEKVLLVSGRRQYLCWTLPLEPFSRGVQSTTIAIILARSSRVAGHLRRSCEQYKLTRRECEAVLLLSEGLTSKQIARRMNISAHTVKAFLHLIMIKLGVTTRSGIVGKLNSQVADEQTDHTNNLRDLQKSA